MLMKQQNPVVMAIQDTQLGERNLIFRFTDPPTQFFSILEKKNNSKISQFQQFHVQPKQVLNFPFTVECAKHQ
jgi:hypothetical protein